MKTFLITLIFTVSVTSLTFSQSAAGVEKQDVYNAEDGRTANWYAVNPYEKSVTLEVKITLSGCNVKSKTEKKKIYVSAKDKTYIGFDKQRCYGKNNNYMYRSVSVISSKFN